MINAMMLGVLIAASPDLFAVGHKFVTDRGVTADPPAIFVSKPPVGGYFVVGGDGRQLTGKTYAQARKASVASGKPLLVFITGDNCRYCRILSARLSGLPLAQYEVSVIHCNSLEGRRLRKGTAIPQLVMYAKNKESVWKHWRLIGDTSTSRLQSFLSSSLVYSGK